MYGLAEIRAMNAHAALTSNAVTRQKRGLKPANEVEKLHRKKPARSTRSSGPKTVRLQGREVTV